MEKKMTKSIKQIREEIASIEAKIDNKELKGMAISKARKEIAKLEDELEVLEESIEDEIINDEIIESIEDAEVINDVISEEKDVEVIDEEKIEKNMAQTKIEEKPKEIIMAGTIEDIPDSPKENKTGRKKYRFTYMPPVGSKMTLKFPSGDMIVRYGQTVYLTEKERICFPQWFKAID